MTPSSFATARLVAALLWLVAPAAAQDVPAAAQDVPAVDPYTEGRSGTLAAAGYENLGPFRVGSRFQTTSLDDGRHGARICWIETAHFKLGVQLRAWSVPKGRREQIAAELRALRDRLPTVPARAETLDPWLRAHLFAARCEAIYHQVEQQLGVTDHDFPEQPRGRMDDSWMGLGPYLGQGDKFVVLLLDDEQDFDRFCHTFCGRDQVNWPLRYNHGWRKSLTFVTCTRFQGSLYDDTALHGHVVYNVVYNLLDGFRHLCHETPVWFKTGLAQWHLRRICPQHPNFDRPPVGAPRTTVSSVDWPVQVAGMVRGDSARPAAELAGFREFTPFRATDYMLAWSRVSFLLDRHGDSVGWFWSRVKQPLMGGRGTPDWHYVTAQQDRALQQAFGYASWGEFDADWAHWVLTADGAVARRTRATQRRRR